MNYTEAIEFIREKFIPLLYKRFNETWPDTFVKCSTKDLDVYEKANGNMYSHYIKYINSLMDLNRPDRFKDSYKDFNYIKTLYEECKATDNFAKWCIENFEI